MSVMNQTNIIKLKLIFYELFEEYDFKSKDRVWRYLEFLQLLLEEASQEYIYDNKLKEEVK